MFCKDMKPQKLAPQMRADARQVTWCSRPIRRTGDNEWITEIDNIIQVPSRCYRGLREITRKQRIKHNRTAGGSDDEVPRNDEEVMLARQRPWRACRRAGAEEGKDSPWSPRNLGNTRQAGS